MNRTHLAAGIAMLAFTSCAFAQDSLPRPDGHAPISLMGDHCHAGGGLMFSYRTMYMVMDGMRNGDSEVSTSEVHSGFSAVSPVDMSMTMHMLGAMYGATDNLTLMVMGNYQRKDMDHAISPMAVPLIGFNGGSGAFSASTKGFGDTSVSALIRLPSGEADRLHLTLGVSLPTGSIGETDAIPGPGGIAQRQLPAAMQLGSGTIDFLPAITYTAFQEQTSWGVQARGTIRTNENAHGYRYGNRAEVELWGAWQACRAVSLSFGVAGKWEDHMHGQQSDLLFNLPFGPMPRSVTTAFAENYGGERIDFGIGANWVIQNGFLAGQRLAVDAKIPVYQDLNGYQLETDFAVTVGWQASF